MRSLAALLLPRLASLRSQAGQERGDGPVQSAILAFGVISLSLLLIQAGLFYHAHTIASNAAQVGVDSSRLYNGSGGAGQAAAQAYISTAGPKIFSTVSVSSSRSSQTATVVVTARSVSLVPGASMPQIRVSAQAPVERVTDS